LKIVVWGLCAVITALFPACPPYLPEKVQIKTEPAIYLPLGSPNSVQDELNAFYDDLAEAKPSGGAALYDFHDEENYGDIRVYIIKVELIEGIYLTEALPDIPNISYEKPMPDILIDFSKAGFPKTGTQSGFDLSGIQDILGAYDGLKFRSVPVYLYVSGPKRIFDDDNVTVSVTALGGDNTRLPGGKLLSDKPVTPQTAPVFPYSKDDSMTGPLPDPSVLSAELDAKPKLSFDLAAILNMDNPPSSLKFEYTIKIEPVTVKYTEREAVKKDFDTPLSAILAVVLPLQFDVTKDVPILAGEDAISLLEEEGDLFGRVSEDDEGSASMKDIFEMLRSLVININIENNIGLAGYAPVYKGKPNSENEEEEEEENLLGKISLSGLSGISLSKPEIAYPFNIWVEMYLGKDQVFEIKRLPEEGTEAPPPLKLSLSIIAHTRIDKTF
jgi:hypothetical protein